MPNHPLSLKLMLRCYGKLFRTHTFNSATSLNAIDAQFLIIQDTHPSESSFGVSSFGVCPELFSNYPLSNFLTTLQKGSPNDKGTKTVYEDDDKFVVLVSYIFFSF